MDLRDIFSHSYTEPWKSPLFTIDPKEQTEIRVLCNVITTAAVGSSAILFVEMFAFH